MELTGYDALYLAVPTENIFKLSLDIFLSICLILYDCDCDYSYDLPGFHKAISEGIALGSVPLDWNIILVVVCWFLLEVHDHQVLILVVDWYSFVGFPNYFSVDINWAGLKKVIYSIFNKASAVSFERPYRAF